MIDTHTHLDGEEFAADLPEVVSRAKEAGVEKVFVPAIDLRSCHTVLSLCRSYSGWAYPMLGLHPEEVKADYREQLAAIRQLIEQTIAADRKGGETPPSAQPHSPLLAIGEVGLDYYWSREFEAEQLDAFRQQVEWAVELRLPLMIHCRKAQNEMVTLLKDYKHSLPGGVFHCFTGNALEAAQLLQFDGFVLGIGGVSTFKKSPLAAMLAQNVPADRIVIETDSPYMAPTPLRGQRNESAYVRFVLQRLADAYGLAPDELDRITTATAKRVFRLDS